MGNLADLIAELLTDRQLDLNRLAAQKLLDIGQLLLDVQADVEARLTGDLTDFQRGRADRLIVELQQAASNLIREFTGEFVSELPQLAQSEANYIAAAVNQAVGVDLVRILPQATLATLADAQTVLMEGATIGEWFRRTDGDTQFRIAQAVRQSIAQGETFAKAKNRLKDVLEGTTKRNLMSTTITAIQTVTGKVQEQTWLANQDVIRAVQQISTLDSRTSDICMSYSGKVWTLPDFKPEGHSLPYAGGVPRHFRCRSRMVPITRPASEIGGVDLPMGTRASMDGQVAADLSFDDWLKRKPREFIDEMLGAGRAELFTAGKITLTDLISPETLKPRTLAQLRRL